MLTDFIDLYKKIKWYIKLNVLYELKDKDVETIFYIKKMNFSGKENPYEIPLINLISLKNWNKIIVSWRTNGNLNYFKKLYSDKMEISIKGLTIYQDEDVLFVHWDNDKIESIFFQLQSNIVTLQKQIKEIVNTYDFLWQKENDKYEIISCEEFIFHNNNQKVIDWLKEINYCVLLKCKNKKTGETLEVDLFDVDYKKILDKNLINKNFIDRVKNELNIDLLKLGLK